jgi:hypothetical protein
VQQVNAGTTPRRKDAASRRSADVQAKQPAVAHRSVTHLRATNVSMANVPMTNVSVTNVSVTNTAARFTVPPPLVAKRCNKTSGA